VIVGRTAPETAIEAGVPTAPIWNSEVWMPAIAFELAMNWRREPCCWTPAFAPSSSTLSPSAFVTTLNENP